jgi:predicted negative regulator of RcsB-dependent stress response
MENNLILITCIILMLLAVFVWQYMKFDKKKALTMPKEALRYNDDSIKSAKAIGQNTHDMNTHDRFQSTFIIEINLH